ncbi:Ig-like domain-containing protein [Patescibacteria group bacterium]|nr:Ig-like domain-containing protein [Patescibacteria group bacterium]
MKPIDRRNFYLLIGIVVSIILIIIAITIATQSLSLFGRAAGPTGVSSLLSTENSYLFASPVSADANGTSVIRVTVILMNSQGLGISGQRVNLKVSGPATVRETQPVSDSFGRTMFDLTSNTQGDFTVSATVADIVLPQTVSVSFQ